MSITEKKLDLSIIMPVYNASEFLNDSVGDILCQTFEGFELICVDDGSTDQSGEILDRYANNDKRVSVIHQDNQGGGVARNAGMEAAKGKYILFLDADDRFEHNMLELVFNEAERTSSDVLVFGVDTFNHITGVKGRASWAIKKNGNKIEGNPFDAVNTSVWNKLFRKEFIDILDIRFQNNRIVDTMCFVAIALLGSEKTVIVHDILLHYRTNNSNSIIANADRYPLEIYLALKEIYNEIKKRDYLSDCLPYYYEFAMENIRIRLNMLKRSDTFHELYTYLHEGGLDDVGLTERIDDPDRYRDWDYIQQIREYNAEEFLYNKLKTIKDLGFTDMTSFDIHESVIGVCRDKRVWIHGSGMVGKCYIRRLMKLGIEISTWSDGKIKEPGYPVTSIQDAITKEFDVVVLAVESEQTAELMKKDLCSNGVDLDKIIWEQPIRI